MVAATFKTKTRKEPAQQARNTVCRLVLHFGRVGSIHRRLNIDEGSEIKLGDNSCSVCACDGLISRDC